MKSYDELADRFESIPELPVSEEMLGAYLERTLHDVELSETSELISTDGNLRELLKEVAATRIEDMASDTLPLDLFENDLGYGGIGLSPELSSNDLAIDGIEKVDINSDDGDRILSEEALYSQNTENSFGVNTLNLYDMSNNSKTIIYGEKGENISDPVYVQQPDDHSCALRSQQIVLRDFGIDIPFKDLEQIALDCQVYTNEGTYTYDIGKVLQLAGVDMHQTIGNSVDDLINELAQGHRVIVSVDAHELWHNKTMVDRLKNWLEDKIGHQGGNHALIVAGVEIDPSNPNNNKVILTDPGSGHLRIEYPMEQFKNAWGDSNCFMAATDNPAPYQYDQATGLEIPSNFEVQQYVNAFVANNSYQLSPDLINVPQDYKPAFVGHIEMIGDIDYGTFKADYDSMVAKRIPSFLSVKEQIEDLTKFSGRSESNNSLEKGKEIRSSFDQSPDKQNNGLDKSNQNPKSVHDDDDDDNDDDDEEISKDKFVNVDDGYDDDNDNDDDDDDDDGDDDDSDE